MYLYDYDALEPFTEVKIRSNTDRIDGEEEIPSVLRDGVVFLPEEMITGLRIRRRALHEHFRAVHGDLLTTGYWERIQQDLLAGHVPEIRVYPDERRAAPRTTRGVERASRSRAVDFDGVAKHVTIMNFRYLPQVMGSQT